jgi:predicted RNase H-like nuclease (RuvC/YqgF family)
MSDTDSSEGGECTTKTVRSKPFSDKETNLLLELVRDKRSIIESKKSGFMDTDRKWKTWEILTDEFNSSSEASQRTTSKLRKRWENCKRTAKKDVTSHRSIATPSFINKM